MARSSASCRFCAARTVLRASLSALCLIVAATTVSARPNFPHPVTTSLDPNFVLTTDIDGDGILDLLVCDFALLVYLGDGDGTFAPPVKYRIPLGHPSSRLAHGALGDFNADGHQDLVAMPGGATGVNSMLVYFGHGDGTFALPAAQLSDLGTGHVVVADLNGDTAPDLVVSSQLDGVGVLLGLPGGQFGPATLLPGLPDGGGVAVADFDGDGKTDVVLTHRAWGLVVVAPGNGDGTFGPSTTYDVDDGPTWVAAADVDGDETIDLVVANNFSDSVSILRGVGDGTFGAAESHVAGDQPLFVTVSDLDRDGIQDLAVSSLGDYLVGSISILLGTGGGQFEAAAGFNWTTWGVYGLAIGDFDRDGALDLANASQGTYLVGVLFGVGDGTFIDAEEVRVGNLPTAIDVGDLDGDGRLDLAMVSERREFVSLVLATGAGTFAPAIEYPVGVAPSSIVVVELTGDAHPDLAVANEGPPGNVSLFEGLGDGTFVALGSLPVGVFVSAPTAIASADFDGDDHQDLVVTDRGSGKLSVYLGDGDGTFSPQTFVPVGLGPEYIAVGDLDGNEVPDVVAVNSVSEDVSVLLGVGDGTFVAAPSLTGRPDLVGVVLGDVNGDSRQDLVTASLTQDQVFAYLGHGDGTFAFPVIQSTDFNTWRLAMADLDDDGRLDLVSMDVVEARVLRGNGGGSFTLEHTYAKRSGTEPIVAADLNLDGRNDLVALSEYFHSASVLLNQAGPTSFTIAADRVTLVWPAVTGATSYDVYRGTLAGLVDLDGDGLPDAGYGDCMTALDDDPKDTFFVDAEVPATAGDGFFYLLSVIDGAGESGLGTTSAGLIRQAATACP